MTYLVLEANRDGGEDRTDFDPLGALLSGPCDLSRNIHN